MSAHADCFTVAILKGAVEGDPHLHFAALGGFEVHLRDAVELGVVNADATPTLAGHEAYRRFRLDYLPPGRAYLWPQQLLTNVLQHLNGEAR